MNNINICKTNKLVNLMINKITDYSFVLSVSKDVIEYGISYNGKKWDIVKRDDEGFISTLKCIYPRITRGITINVYYMTKFKRVDGLITMYIVADSDKNQYTDRLQRLGISYTNISILEEPKQRYLVNLFEELFEKYPEAKNVIHVLWIQDYQKEMASYLMEMTQDGMYASIIIDEGYFKYNYSKKTIRYTVCHEFAHVLNACLVFKISGLELGQNDLISIEKHNKVLDVVSKKLCDGIMKKNGISMQELEDYIGIYGLTSTAESFAEAFARKIYNNSDNIFIQNVVQEYNKLMYSKNDHFAEKIMEECAI